MKTSKRKKNILFITILSIVGLIGAMALHADDMDIQFV